MNKYNFNWVPGLFLITYHLVLLVVLPLYVVQYGFPWKLALFSFFLVYITGMSVTAGYHRLYSHLTYKLNPVVEGILLFFSTMATQGSALRWSYDHRCHHAFLDTDRDPHSIKRGFWYAHFLWLFEKPKPIENKVVADLLRNPLVRFQHRFYPILMIITNTLFFLFVGWCFDNYWGAFVFAWLLRTFFLHHFTWFINSLAHTWGARTFCQEISAADNYVLCLLTFGEGYHNYHHMFAYDYRNGVRWYHFDPTKWLIWILHKCNLAYQLRKVPPYLIQETLLLERKQLLMEKIQTRLNSQKEEWEEKITSLIDAVLAKAKQIKELNDRYYALKKEKIKEKSYLRELNLQIKALNKSLREEYRRWVALYRHVNTIASH